MKKLVLLCLISTIVGIMAGWSCSPTKVESNPVEPYDSTWEVEFRKYADELNSYQYTDSTLMVDVNGESFYIYQYDSNASCIYEALTGCLNTGILLNPHREYEVLRRAFSYPSFCSLVWDDFDGWCSWYWLAGTDDSYQEYVDSLLWAVRDSVWECERFYYEGEVEE